MFGVSYPYAACFQRCYFLLDNGFSDVWRWSPPNWSLHRLVHLLMFVLQIIRQSQDLCAAAEVALRASTNVS